MRSPHTATREWPPLATRESPSSNEDPTEPKINKFLKNLIFEKLKKNRNIGFK